MDDRTYDQLADALRRKGGGIPAVKCKEFRNVIDALFTEEEAILASQMPEMLVSADMLADKTKQDQQHVADLLDKMTKKGLLFSLNRQGTNLYTLLAFVPGIFENQFNTGPVDERAKKLARIFDNYLNAIKQIAVSKPGIFSEVPFARVIAVNREISSNITINTYDELTPYIEKAKYIGLVTCFCRHKGELLDDPCTKPKDVCIAVGPGAKYMAEYGFGKLITNEEALKILQRAEDAGLVHCSSNTGKYIDMVCNCCTCHCMILQSLKNSNMPSLAASSSFTAEIDTSECIGCDNCIRKCPMEAISIEDDIAQVDKKRCIGCGLCVRSCPTGAILLKKRENASVPIPDSIKLNQAIISSTKSN
ncbi:MAG: 4Fe-4S binding protein [Dehalococcoidia bacterium]|nr:4Fe-4S binding protein [Dehalococcoidia bacterium]